MSSAPSVQPRPNTDSNARKLVVGREIVLSGDIASCERLVVEGTVHANVECQDLRIEAGGLFDGSAIVGNAEVLGRFQGALIVGGRLHVRAGGNVAATVRYHEIEIEQGGRVSGDLEALLDKPPTPAAVAPIGV